VASLSVVFFLEVEILLPNLEALHNYIFLFFCEIHVYTYAHTPDYSDTCCKNNIKSEIMHLSIKHTTT